MDLLKVPAVLAGFDIQRDDRDGEQIVAFALAAIEIRPRISGREIDQSKLGIHRRGLPDRRSAVLPRVTLLRPAIVTELTGAGNGIESPQRLAILGTERTHAPTGQELRTRKAGDDHAVVVQRRAGDRVT